MSLCRIFAIATVGVLIGFSLVGSTRHITNDRLTGEYRVSGDWGRSVLILNPDGTFAQKLITRGKDIKSIEGKWRVLDNDSHAYTRVIAFQPFINMVADQMGAIAPSATCTVEAVGFRSVWIDVDNDAGTTYKKW
jgi:hypothetical protein